MPDLFSSLLKKLCWILLLSYFFEQVRDLPQYQAVASNLSGSTPKDLFEDITEELDKQVIWSRYSILVNGCTIIALRESNS